MLERSSPPRVSVAIPTYHRAKFLRETLEGVTRQNYPAGWEILVIDNNSPDDTRAVVESFAHSLPAPKYFLERQQGLDFARNRAIAEASGEIIVFADDDILVETDWLTQMTAPFDGENRQRIGAVGGEVIPVFPHGLPAWVAEWHSPLRFRAELGPIPPQQSPMGANVAFPRRVFAQLGQFHTALDRSAGNYFSGGDSEMIRRVRQAGLEVWFAPLAAVRHQMPANRTTFRYAARHGFDSARSRVIDRAGQPGAKTYLLSRFLGNFVRLLACTLLAIVNLLLFRLGAVKKATVRGWRACGYLYQIPRSLLGKV